MEDLVGNNLQIKLSIKEGRNFDNILQPTIIVTTLNNHSLETDLTQPENCPQYFTDLVWEAERKSLRKMRSGQTPLKIECFTMSENGAREKIGYILLSVRCAQILPKSKNAEKKMSWHTILGLKSSLKGCKPELLISLTIEDTENSQNVAKDFEALSRGPRQENPVPLIFQEGLIQLGPVNSCQDIFLLSIAAGTLTNVDSLVKDVPDESNRAFVLWYNVLESDVQLKPFNMTSGNSLILNEKIVVKIKSSLSILKNYFERNPYFSVTLKCRNEIVARSKVDIRSLVPAEFLESTENVATILERQCILVKDKVTNARELKPRLGLKLKCQFAESEVNHELPKSAFANGFSYEKELENIEQASVFSHRNPAGDSEKTKFPRFNFFQNQDFSCENELSGSKETYHCYCLNISLSGVTILASQTPESRTVEFRFHHPKTENTSTLCPKFSILSGENTRLQNVACKLHFISSADEIRNLLFIFPPRISVYDVGTKLFVAQSMFDIQKLFDQKQPECEYEAILMDENQAQVGALDVKMSLEDHGPYYKNKKRTPGGNLGPPILDDSLAYKIVDELETWKERQMQIFNFELKRKEELHFKVLSEEWQKRKETLESKLASSMEQCKVLANSLNSATEDLRIRRLKSIEKETRLTKANEDLQKRYEAKLQDYQEAAERMKQDFISKLTLVENREKLFLAQIDALKEGNEALRCTMKQRTEKLEDLEKGSPAQDQLASLLQEVKDLTEKLESVQSKKSFFKEQWAKGLREIHKMKSEHQHAMEIQIKNSKEELRNLNLEDILCADSEALASDQMHLNQIQREVDVLRPKSAHATDRFFSPNSNRISQLNRSLMRPEVFRKPEEYEEKLRMLIEERDTLMKTKSYSLNDDVIVTLNNEIKLLMS